MDDLSHMRSFIEIFYGIQWLSGFPVDSRKIYYDSYYNSKSFNQENYPVLTSSDIGQRKDCTRAKELAAIVAAGYYSSLS